MLGMVEGDRASGRPARRWSWHSGLVQLYTAT